MTDWTPDTCGCTLRVAEDWSSADTLVRCDQHDGIADDDHFDVVLLENQIKNRLLAYIAGNFPAALEVNQPLPAQQPANSWAAAYGLAGQLSFDANRNLMLQTSGLPPSEVATIQTYCDATWGAGKVTVR